MKPPRTKSLEILPFYRFLQDGQYRPRQSFPGGPSSGIEAQTATELRRGASRFFDHDERDMFAEGPGEILNGFQELLLAGLTPRRR
jgi:hypothetical protein